MSHPIPGKLGYLVSQYPAVSHTFILREVIGLRALGQDIAVASINAPDRRDDKLTADELREKQQVFCVKQSNPVAALGLALWCLLSSPLSAFGSLYYSLKLAGRDLASWPLYLAYWVEAVLLQRWARQQQISHLHVHFATPAATVALIFSRLCGLPFSITIHGPDEFYDVSKYRLKEKFEAASFLICISDFARSQVMRVLSYQHWQKIEVCRLGVFPAQFPLQQKPAADAATGLRILCVGRLCEAKGQAVLIQAVHALIQQGQRCQLTLIGGGELRGEFEQLVVELGLSGQVHFTGPLNQDQVRRHFAEADVFVLASFAEGVPIVLMESMALGIPVIATQITGIPELIEGGQCGVLVAAGSQQQLTQALQQHVQTSAEAIAVQIERARARIEADYNLDINVPQLHRLFQQRVQ